MRTRATLLAAAAVLLIAKPTNASSTPITDVSGQVYLQYTNNGTYYEWNAGPIFLPNESGGNAGNGVSSSDFNGSFDTSTGAFAYSFSGSWLGGGPFYDPTLVSISISGSFTGTAKNLPLDAWSDLDGSGIVSASYFIETSSGYEATYNVSEPAFWSLSVFPEDDQFYGSVNFPAGTAPEPSSLLLLGTGLLGFSPFVRRLTRP